MPGLSYFLIIILFYFWLFFSGQSKDFTDYIGIASFYADKQLF